VRRGAVVCGLLALSLVTAAGCGNGDSPVTRSVVTIFAPYRGAEADHFLAELAPWAERHGIDVRYTGTADLAHDLRFRVDNAEPPDIALVPQPGLVAELYRDGSVPRLPRPVERTVATNIGAAARSLGKVDQVQVGFPFRVSVKGLVWYRPQELTAVHARPPRTLRDLGSLVERLSGGGETPWCLGVEAEGATGWAATDWVENLVLRDWGADVYGQWVSGQVPFSDPRIRASFDHFRSLVLAPGRVAGGVARAIATPVDTASAPMFTDPPSCVLYQQASFALGWFPAGQTVGPRGTIDFFPLPEGEAHSGVLEVGTDIVVSFRESAAVDSVMNFLASPDAARSWVRAGGFISPQHGIPLSAYRGSPDHAVVEAIGRASGLVVDASDAMPPDVGTDRFWTGITKWMAGTMTYDELAADLDAARSGPVGT
jgi:alpha-glucoside transport system substrate-binding protein